MAQQHSTRQSIRQTSKVLTWEQEQALMASKRFVKGKVHAKRQRITEDLEAKGLTYRDR